MASTRVVAALCTPHCNTCLIGKRLRSGKCTVKVLETRDKWFGVTYKEDKELVVNSFKELIAVGVYQEELYADLV